MDTQTKKRVLGALSCTLLLLTAITNVKIAENAMVEAEENAQKFEEQKQEVFDELRRKFEERYPPTK